MIDVAAGILLGAVVVGSVVDKNQEQEPNSIVQIENAVADGRIHAMEVDDLVASIDLAFTRKKITLKEKHSLISYILGLKEAHQDRGSEFKEKCIVEYIPVARKRVYDKYTTGGFVLAVLAAPAMLLGAPIVPLAAGGIAILSGGTVLGIIVAKSSGPEVVAENYCAELFPISDEQQ